MKVLITGGAGLVGSECCRLFTERGWSIISVDNYMRGKIFGKDGDTSVTMRRLMKEYNIEHYEMDIRDEKIVEILKKLMLLFIQQLNHLIQNPSKFR
jgi:CDP-paratose 2-epimerase